MPSLVLTRDNGYADRVRKYQVFIDGRKVGEIGAGGTFNAEVEPGQHTLQVTIDWQKTEVMSFIADQHDARFHVRSNLRGWKLLVSFVYALIPSKWIILERA